MTHPARCPVSELPGILRRFRPPEAEDADSRHWSVFSAALGRFVDERLYQHSHPGPWEWAEDVMGLTKGEYGQALKLWSIQKRSFPAVPYEDWLQVKKARALLVGEILSVGGEAREWVTKAQEAKTTGVLRQEVEKRLGKETWVRWSLDVPQELVGVLEEALVKALPEVVEGEIKPEMVKDKANRFRCLEVVSVHFLQTHGAVFLGVNADDMTGD